MDGVEVGDAQVADPPFGPDLHQVEEAVQPAGVGIAPGMELEHVQPVGSDADERAFDRRLHLPASRDSRLGNPLGEYLHFGTPAPHRAGDQLGGAVMVGHVERGEAGVHRWPERAGRVPGVESGAGPLLIGHLPQSGQHPGHLQPRREPDAFDGRAHSGGRVWKSRSVSTPRRRRPAISRR